MYSVTVQMVKMTSLSNTREQIRKKRKSSLNTFGTVLTSTVPPLSQCGPPRNAHFSNERATKSQHSPRQCKKALFPPQISTFCKDAHGRKTNRWIPQRIKKTYSSYNHSFLSRLGYLALLLLGIYYFSQ